jgi:aminoacrylate hydrolase
MAALETQGISLHYELFGDRRKPAVLLLAGLGGAGASFGPQTARFAADHFVIVPDHRGTGQTTRSADGYTIAQHAADMASLVEHLDTGPVHVVGTSTGGAIAQLMALDHAHTVCSVTMASSFARADAYLRRQFALRRKLMAEADAQTIYSCYALFLFAPHYASSNPQAVQAWIDRAASHPLEREVALKRIDMIMAHDAMARLGAIRQPVLCLGGDHDLCTPFYLSEEIAQAIPGAELAVLPGGGHFIHYELEERFFDVISAFLARVDRRAQNEGAQAVA